MNSRLEKFNFRLSWAHKMLELNPKDCGEVLRKIMDYMFKNKPPKEFNSISSKKIWEEIFYELKEEKLHQESCENK